MSTKVYNAPVGKLLKEENPRYRRLALQVWSLIQKGLTGVQAMKAACPGRKLKPRTASQYAMRMKQFVEEHRLDEDIRETFLAHDINPELLAERTREGLDATRTIQVGSKEKPKTIEVDDFGVRLGYLQFAYKVLNPELQDGAQPVNYVLVINGDIEKR
jgi:hypothetical protein